MPNPDPRDANSQPRDGEDPLSSGKNMVQEFHLGPVGLQLGLHANGHLEPDKGFWRISVPIEGQAPTTPHDQHTPVSRSEMEQAVQAVDQYTAPLSGAREIQEGINRLPEPTPLELHKPGILDDRFDPPNDRQNEFQLNAPGAQTDLNTGGPGSLSWGNLVREDGTGSVDKGQHDHATSGSDAQSHSGSGPSGAHGISETSSAPTGESRMGG